MDNSGNLDHNVTVVMWKTPKPVENPVENSGSLWITLWKTLHLVENPVENPARREGYHSI